MNELFADRRVLIGAVVAGLVVLAIALWAAFRPTAPESPPQGQGLVVQTGRDDDIKIDPEHPIRCFVGGQMVGELTVSDCARRNGVEPDSMDVGLDASGAMAAHDANANAPDQKSEDIDTSTGDENKSQKADKPPEE
jgi:hypothetical protein